MKRSKSVWLFQGFWGFMLLLMLLVTPSRLQIWVGELNLCLIATFSDLNNVSLVYNTSPTNLSTYYVRRIPGTDECFVVENRQYTRTYDKSLPGAVVGLSGGLLIWNIKGEGLNLGLTDLREADGIASDANQLEMANDMFRPSVYTSGKINDITTPANLRLRNGSFSSFAISNFVNTGNPITVNFQINSVAPPTNLVITNPVKTANILFCSGLQVLNQT